MSTLRTLVVLPVLLAALSAESRASIPSPPSGTTFELVLGDIAIVKLKNAQQCTFDHMATASIPGVVLLSPESGTDEKGATIRIEAIGVGSTSVMVSTFNGTCPMADHVYDVNVSLDWKASLKDFDLLAKGAFKDFKSATKGAFSDYGDALLDLRLQYKAGDLDDDELHDGFHDAAVDLRRGYQLAGTTAFLDVVGGGSAILAAADAGIGTAPSGFFAGGCGSYDWFQDSVCGVQADFHDKFDSASKKAIKQLAKLDAPMFGQWNTLLPLVSSGPLYPDQFPVPPLAQRLAAPLTITTRPATDAKTGDGRLLVSGSADPALTGPFTVTITRMVVDVPDEVGSAEPPVAEDGEWSALFEDLSPGAYLLSTRYGADEAAVELSFAINTRF